MNVFCPNCNTLYRVDPAKVPENGVRARCAVCSAVFAVRRDGTAPTARAPAVTAAPTPPAAAAPATTVVPEPVHPVDAGTEQGRVMEPTSEPAEPAPPPVPLPPAAVERPVFPPSPPVSVPAVPPRAGLGAAAPPAAPGRGLSRPAMPPPGGSRGAPAGWPVPPVMRPAAPAGARAPAVAAPSIASSAPPAPPPETLAPPPPEAADEGPVAPPPTPVPASRPINPFLSQDPAAKARRLARALISDMVVYHPAKRQEGLREGTLKDLFDEEIKKSWEEYSDQVGKEVAESTSYFKEALNEILADGRQIF
jgi:predicted Zn finger-like uncharacterized protein